MPVIPLNENEQKLASEAVRDLRVALSNFFLYDPENSMVQQSLERLLQDLNELFSTRPQISLGETEGQLLIEGTPVDTKFAGSTSSITDLFHVHQLHSLTFLQGVTREELIGLLQLIRPKALEAGVTLQDALKGVALPHVQVNQKIFVAVKEGEKLVAMDDLGGEENVEEAMQSLQAFLSVFSRVKPDNKKREVLGALQAQLGPMSLWDVTGTGGTGGEGGGEGDGAAGPSTGSSGPSGHAPQAGSGTAWGELVGGLRVLKQILHNTQSPPDPQKAQENIDGLLQKMVHLLEDHGLMDESVRTQLNAEPEEEQESLFDREPTYDEWRLGNFVSLLDPAREEAVAKALEELAVRPDPELSEAVWKLLWVGTQGEQEDIACLALRHLSRIKRETIKRERQIEGFQLLRGLLKGPIPIAKLKEVVVLVKDWWKSESSNPDWTESAFLLKQLKQISEASSPSAVPQATLARETLHSLLAPENVRKVLDHAVADERAGGPAGVILSLAGPEAGALLMEYALQTPPTDPGWERMLDLLYWLQAEGMEVFEKWYASHDITQQLPAFLRIIERVPLPPDLARVFEEHWAAIPPETRKKIMELAAKWECKSFRPLILGTLFEPGLDLARQALKVLPRIHLEGDSLKVIEAVEQRPYGHKDEKELFSLMVCKALGEMKEPLSLTALMGWGQSYGILERGRGKSLTIRMAAVEALGNFRSRQVESYLEKLVQKEEKDLRSVAEESLKLVREKLAETAASSTGGMDALDSGSIAAASPPISPPIEPLHDGGLKGLME